MPVERRFGNYKEMWTGFAENSGLRVWEWQYSNGVRLDLIHVWKYTLSL